MSINRIRLLHITTGKDALTQVKLVNGLNSDLFNRRTNVKGIQTTTLLQGLSLMKYTSSKRKIYIFSEDLAGAVIIAVQLRSYLTVLFTKKERDSRTT